GGKCTVDWGGQGGGRRLPSPLFCCYKPTRICYLNQETCETETCP
uniref:Antimicrobial peptide 2 n=1 Tax=Taraxacum officinale TaxID=50225 RepID=AMP2_TAROF|nr:RecName: Full=Antimicrobial peptide 2; Short=ToAMP2 [Taraxacum officinale]